MVAHVRRPVVRPGAHVLVTLELARGLPSLCKPASAELLARILAEVDGRFGMHVLEHSLYPDHLHLIVRARNMRTLSRGMKGVCVRTARGLNAVWRRSGPVFADRFEVRVLETESERRAARRFPCAWRSAPESSGPRRTAACRKPGQAAPKGPARRPDAGKEEQG